jgi:hypothetical protein
VDEDRVTPVRGIDRGLDRKVCASSLAHLESPGAARLAEVARTVPVVVQLSGVEDVATVVTGIAPAVPVPVGLIGIGLVRAVIAGVPPEIAVAVILVRVTGLGTVIRPGTDPVSVEVVFWVDDTKVADVPETILVRIQLVFVTVVGTVVLGIVDSISVEVVVGGGIYIVTETVPVRIVVGIVRARVADVPEAIAVDVTLAAGRLTRLVRIDQQVAVAVEPRTVRVVGGVATIGTVVDGMTEPVSVHVVIPIRQAGIAIVPHVVSIPILLSGVRNRRTVVARVSDTVLVDVQLVGIVDVGTIVAVVPQGIVITVFLSRVRCAETVVTDVACPVSILVSLFGVRLQRAVVQVGTDQIPVARVLRIEGARIRVASSITCSAESIPVGIGAFVTGVSLAVGIVVRLCGIPGIRTTVDRVADPVSVPINLDDTTAGLAGLHLVGVLGASVTGVAGPVPVRVLLIRVRREGAVVDTGADSVLIQIGLDVSAPALARIALEGIPRAEVTGVTHPIGIPVFLILVRGQAAVIVTAEHLAPHARSVPGRAASVPVVRDPVVIEITIADVPDSVPVTIFLVDVRLSGAVVTGIAYGVAVGVRLSRVVIRGAVITGVTQVIRIPVALVGVRGGDTVVPVIGDAVFVAIPSDVELVSAPVHSAPYDARVAVQVEREGLADVPIAVEIQRVDGHRGVVTRIDGGRALQEPQIVIECADGVVQTVPVREPRVVREDLVTRSAC